MNLKLYYFNSCPYCQKVFRFIEMNDIEGIKLKNIYEDKEAKEELIKIGGINQVPCLFIDEEPLYESDDIINWLKENLL